MRPPSQWQPLRLLLAALVRVERLTACRYAIANDTIAPSGTALVDG